MITSLLMLALWLVQVKTKNASFVDIGWTAGLCICAALYAALTQGMFLRKMILLGIVVVWSGRLCGLLIRRLLSHPGEDARYQRIRREWKTGQDMKFFWMFQFQGFLDVVLSWPFLLICMNRHTVLVPVEIFGIILCLTGIVGESLADEQMRRFKADPKNHGKVCDVGLWYFSRHPNYFFEWTIWLGYFFFALAMPNGWTALSAPALMSVFLWKVSGIPLAEAQALKSRGEAYRLYQKQTSMIIPWLKRKVL